MSSIYTSGGYAGMPADSGHGRIVLPMVGGGRGRGHKYIVAGAGF